MGPDIQERGLEGTKTKVHSYNYLMKTVFVFGEAISHQHEPQRMLVQYLLNTSPGA